ncbi:hypothetical protein, partial [Bacteroides clarus]
MKIFRLLLMLCGMLFTGIGFADEIDGMRFTHIGLEDGLSHSTIFGINQDKEGLNSTCKCNRILINNLF